MEKTKIVILVGSSKSDGDTTELAKRLQEKIACDMVNIGDYKIQHYDYEHMNKEDDFLPLIKTLIETYSVFIFATPVYWYAMSGIMKVFFDRLSDLLTIEKDLGRQLRGKNMAVVSVSNGNNLGDAFWLPFKSTAEYLGMHYIGDLHTFRNIEQPKELLDFIQKLN